ncbi:hypothetical protein KIN20_037294 [Parelaphostrongylus tenuis]|uniref:F-box domain-containing protein n=1 Tax=Parelaphostrongylus tenuis TaxID=148309 RepID=A0AAD5REJ1_PARTN|nr:hypothetical protein KIN20_037294 [Parelaphostrongylus tenuis]
MTLPHFPLPNDVVLLILLLLDGKDVRSFGNTCKRFRILILHNKNKLPKPVLTWRRARLVFGRRRIILLRPNAPAIWQNILRGTSPVNLSWVFTEDKFLRNFVNFFFVISPDVMYTKCKDLDEHTAEIIRKCVGNMCGKTFSLKMDRCSLDEGALRCFFAYFSPFYLHLSGRFDRSIISDKVLPLSTLFSLFIGVNSFDSKTRTRLSGITVRKIVNNWFQRYSGNSSVCLYENYGNREFLIEIPDCDVSTTNFLRFFKELTLIPHGTHERIRIHNLPKSLIHAISRNVSTFDNFGPALWIEQGLCSNDDVRWWCNLSCECRPWHRRAYDDLMADGLPRDPSQLCDTVILNFSVAISVSEGPLQPLKQLLDVAITLSAG